MVETNPFKIEEAKWTPKNVYEILPPNAISYTGYDYSEGSTDFDQEKTRSSLLDGFFNFFGDLLGGVGAIIGGAINIGGAILAPIINGIGNLIGGIANAIGSIFGGGSGESPDLPLFNPIRTNLEAAIQPQRDKINESLQKTEEILAEQEVLRGQMSESLDEMRAARDRANEAIEKSGQSIEEAQAASAAAEAARQTLEEYNTALNKRITTEFNSAVGRADTAIEKADTLAGELADFKTQASADVEDALSKAQAANDELAALSPQIDEALSNSSSAVAKADQTLADYTAWAKAQKTRIDSAVSKAEAATANVNTLTPQVADAVAQSAKATSDVSTLTPKVTAAQEAASKATSDVSTLTPKVTAAQEAASKATSDVSALTPKVTAAQNAASKATADVSTLTTKVDDATSKASKASADVATLTPKVTTATNDAKKAKDDVAALSPKVTAAQEAASKAASDLSALTPKVTAAQTRADNAFTEAGKVRNEVAPKIEAAQTKGESALAVADKAVDWLRNPNEIGASLIAIDPETKRPNWAEHLDPVTAEENPLNLPNAYKTGDNYARNPRRMAVNVDPSTEYMVSLWVKADKPGSAMTYDIRNQSGDLAFEKRRIVDGFLDAGDNWRTFWIKNVPTEWTQYKKIATPREATRTAEFGYTYFKHSSGDTQDVVQYIADLQIYPLVPSQLDVDQAQNDAIRANSEILRQQGEINEAQRVANLAQKNFNDNQTKWNKASTDATKALVDFTELQKTVNAEQQKFNTFQTDFNTKQTKWNKASEDATKALSDAQQVQSNLNIEQGKLNTLQSNFNTKQIDWNKGTEAALEAQKKVNDNFTKWNDGVTKALAANDILTAKQQEWNEGTIAALEAQKKVNDNFTKWTNGAATAIDANTKAIKALSMPETGESLIAYVTPTDAEVKAGTAKYDIPVWTTGAHRPFNGNNQPPAFVKNAYGAASNESTTTARRVPVTVRPGTKYVLSFWAYGSGKIVIYMYGNGDGYPVRSTRQILVDQTTLAIKKDKDGRRLYDPAENGNSSNVNGTQWLLSGFKPDQLYKWVHYKFEVEFTESTSEVWFHNFYWNWSEISVYGQYLADMQFYPDVPTQADVDDAQNKAIESLRILTENQAKWSDGATKAIQANTDVATALARINGIQVGGRNLLKKSNLGVTNKSDPTGRADLGDSVPSDGEEITISLKGNLGAGNEKFGLYNSGGTTVFGNMTAADKGADGVYRITTKWKSNSTNSYVNIYAMPKSAETNSTIEWVKLERGNKSTDWTPAPEDLPTQKQVDETQNAAIRANTDALKALGKKSLGASLVPYKTPSDQEVTDYAAGKLSYDPWADPEYLDAGHSIASPTRGRVARANANQGTKTFVGSFVTVDSSVEYKVKFQTYSNTTGSKVFIYMRNQAGDLALAETPFADSGKTDGGLVHGLTLPGGIKEWSGVVKFKPGTTEVRFDTFFWNHPTGTTTAVQEFGGLEIVPNIPSQAVVDELQDNAIRKNTAVGSANKQAIEALRDGLNASIELEEVNKIVGDLQEELSKEIDKRAILQEEIDALQTEMIPRTIVSDDRVTYDDQVEISGTKVTAKGSWAGQLAVTYQDRTGNGTNAYPYIYRSRVTRKTVPDGSTRSWTFSQGIERVDYWVYRGRQRTILLANAGPYITGSSFSSGTWGVLATHKVGKTYGTGKIEWRANLQFADQGVTYRFKIEVNGTEVKNVSWKGIGPLTPLGDGKRTLKFEHEFNLPDDATVRVLGYAYNSNSQQARVSLLQGTLVYVQDTAREA